ncbi:ferric reductase-like transmembrane domain-containing protein [Pleurocapsa sp. PCC 7319]|uniref:ferric reductase-like transmembrane domain-containing protein n=1 Tax=Pleurocapsa sp. PCC 7319 TaxID=118161 RepID=UPI00034D921D|nr:ferric reductase-like transmembrane domain-containing protein [Pleurocapsa sp. PCC 7319]
MDTAPLANFLGFLALSSYIATLLPSMLRIVFPQIKRSDVVKLLLKYRRQIGLLAFALAFFHGYLLVLKRNFDFFDLQTYWIYIQGVATFIVFTLLAITSNNWSIKKLKRNWKKLHSLTYLAMFLLTWHVWDKMSSHWSFLTPIGLLQLIIIIALFLQRKRVEQKLMLHTHQSVKTGKR